MQRPMREMQEVTEGKPRRMMESNAMDGGHGRMCVKLTVT